MGAPYKKATDAKAPHVTQCLDPFTWSRRPTRGSTSQTVGPERGAQAPPAHAPPARRAPR